MKDRGLFTAVVLGLSLTVALLWVLGSESPPAAASPSAPEAEADWDGLSISAPAVILDAGTYRMWYQGRGLSFYGTGWTLGYAESPDGVAWTKYAGNPVLEPGETGEWDSAYRGQIALIKDGATHKMWYSGAGFSGSWQVGYATSTDGLEWEIYAGNPVLPAGGPGSWDELECDGPAVIKDGATYKMWYYGCNADYSVCSIGYATSPDGVTWTKYAGNPVLEQTPGEWDESGLSWPRVIKNGATYEMWYHSNGKIGRATSPNGIAWTKYAGNPVLSEGWGGAGISPPATFLLDGTTYKAWFKSGVPGVSMGFGYAESTDGIHWTQPVVNPILNRGQTGVIINANYSANAVEALTLGNTPITITVSDAGGTKASAHGVTDGSGRYRTGFSSWDPERPDIVPGDTVSATANGFSTIIETAGEIDYQVHIDTDVVEGTIDAPWFAPGSLSALCWTYDPRASSLDTDVPADDGSFECDFSGLADITAGMGGQAGYLEPDGDMVSVEWQAPYMEVYYGVLNQYHHAAVSAGGIYAPGHTFWITVTDSMGGIKATATVTSTYEGGKWGDGFRDWWSGGDCCDWSPAEPDIRPGDRVHFRSDDGYENQVRVGAIYGTVDVENDLVTGPIYARWLTQTLEVGCHPSTDYPAIHRWSSAEPDGSVPYFCEWQDPAGGEPWDIQPDDQVMVHYTEPDGDKVYRSMLASEGALLRVYLPLVWRNYDPGLLFFDSFSDPNSGWFVGDQDNTSFGYQGGEYEINAHDAPSGGPSGAPNYSMPGGSSLEADMRLLAGTNIQYGLWWAGLWGQYKFWVEPEAQHYSLLLCSAGCDTLSDGSSAYIHPDGETNHLRMEYWNDRLEVYVNEQLLASVGADAFFTPSPSVKFVPFLAQSPRPSRLPLARTRQTWYTSHGETKQ